MICQMWRDWRSFPGWWAKVCPAPSRNGWGWFLWTLSAIRIERWTPAFWAPDTYCCLKCADDPHSPSFDKADYFDSFCNCYWYSSSVSSSISLHYAVISWLSGLMSSWHKHFSIWLKIFPRLPRSISWARTHVSFLRRSDVPKVLLEVREC